ncbi:MAG: tetratricopeptide repeat protein [Bacteroidales bacterium]|nr:tetratricopeptide repeat protein [Bacteroidales bacterium]
MQLRFNNIKVILFALIVFINTNITFSQAKVTDSLFVEFNEQKNDSVKIDLLIKILRNFYKNSNDTLLTFYNKYEYFIKNKGTFAQKIKSNSIVGFWGHAVGKYNISLKKFNENLKYSILRNDSVTIAASYGNLGNTFLYKDENKKAIEFYNKALKIFEKTGNKKGLANLYGVLGNIFLKMEKPKIAIKNYNKSKSHFKDLKSEFGVATCDMNIGIAYKNLNEFEKALKHFKTAKKTYSEIGHIKGLAEIYGNMGKVSFLQKNYETAISYYKKALKISEDLKLNKNIVMILNWLAECNIAVGNYNKAVTNSHTALKLIKQYSFDNYKKIVYKNLYEANKSKGNYKLALKYLELYKDKTDSVFISEKNENIEKLLTEFETKEKEKEIEILYIKSEKQTSTIRAKQQERNLWFGISILAILIGAISIYYFVKRKKLSEELSAKNKIIRKTLAEKDVLLREIHHRVKNNLQIISSLLNMQSRYLSDDKSKEIINDSKNRIKSMSLIHQKLYLSEDITGIETQSYFNELIDSLITSYGIDNKKVEIKLSIENLILDVDTAIPLGLILNEIITNAFKHGLDKNNGAFYFSFKQISEKELKIIVKDNGNGIPADFDILKTKSYGMKLIKSLSKKLKAEINFKNKDGLEITMKIHKFKASKTS